MKKGPRHAEKSPKNPRIRRKPGSLPAPEIQNQKQLTRKQIAALLLAAGVVVYAALDKPIEYDPTSVPNYESPLPPQIDEIPSSYSPNNIPFAQSTLTKTATLSLIEDSNAAISNKERPSGKLLDIRTFEPPKEGIIIDRHFKKGNKGNIIYIPNHHYEPTQGKSELAMTGITQRQIFRIVQSLLSSYTSVPIVMENWPAEFSAAELKRLLGKSPTYQLLGSIIKLPTAEQRLAAVNEMLGLTDDGVSESLFVVYQDRIEPIGGTSLEDAKEVLAATQADMRVKDIEIGNSTLWCDESKSQNFHEATRAFRRGSISPELLKCFCQGGETMREDVRFFLRSRQKAARKEVLNGLPAAKKGFAVVIAGTLHLPEAVKAMRENGVNYVVVSPREIERESRDTLANPRIYGEDTISKTYLPGEREKCEQFVKKGGK